MKKFFVIFSLLSVIFLSGCGNAVVRESADNTLESRFISNNPNDYFSTVVDSETGIVYILWWRKGGTLGGICPLYNVDGTIMRDMTMTDIVSK